MLEDRSLTSWLYSEHYIRQAETSDVIFMGIVSSEELYSWLEGLMFIHFNINVLEILSFNSNNGYQNI